MRRYFSYHMIISFIILASLFVVPLVLFYSFKTNTQLDELKTREIYNLRLQETVIEKTLRYAINDLLLLKEHVKTSGESVDSYQNSATEKQNLTQDFKAFSIGKHHLFDQLRLLNANGDEVIRINFSEENVQIVGDDSLQNKSHRYYFSELSGLSEDDIYISPFDLNVEYDTVEYPIKPMLRIGTPIIDTVGQFAGAVLINYLGRNILSAVDEIQTSDHYMMLNEDGYWIQNDLEPSVEWSFMFDSVQNQQFQDNFADEWTRIQNNEEGQFRNDLGLFTFQTVYPVRADSLQYLTEENEIETVNIVRDRVNFWKLVSYIDDATLLAQITPIKTERNLILIFFILVSAALAYFITKVRVNKLIAQKNLRDLNNNLEYEVKQRTAEIQEARLKAEESNRLKTAFLNNISHEIRTPLNAILGFTELMLKNDYDKKEIKNFSRIINKQGNGLLEIVNDILDVSKIESGQVTIHDEQAFLYYELNELIESFDKRKAQMNKAHIDLQLDYDCGTENERIIIDMGKLRQILTHLLTNAFKFTEQGKVELKCRRQEKNRILFSVTDTG
ncbi:MAG TPA: histidine kinase dimerization/phospho-acceptor domain-containing protein, partial [Prolixibacteraceae bacterium]|nr:histidine kinase dimerization/phospho-acceptor domain-containing protein [Prolixibacteraceae bacterium]